MRGPFRAFAKRLMAQLTGRINLRVEIGYDPEARVWHVVESDIPGLWLEADTAGELMNKLALAGPEMIELNVEHIMAAYGIRRRSPKRENFHAEVVSPIVAVPC